MSDLSDPGAPARWSSPTTPISARIRVLESYDFETPLGTTMLRREPISVAALITPWNWPMNQLACKVAPALAAGCTMVLKPSELAPLDAVILAEILDAAGLPPGVFNLVHGDGAEVGAPLCAHPDVEMVSFTGSTRAGIAIAQAAAPTVKRVALELGGKSAAIVLDDGDLDRAIPALVRDGMSNSGQSCNAPSRILVHEAHYARACALAIAAADGLVIGLPDDDPDLGPLANAAHHRRVVAMIDQGIAEGGYLLCGGSAKPPGLEAGLFVRPTLFGRVTPGMMLAREEVFGPVQVIMTYRTEEEAIAIANDSRYGLSGQVWGADMVRVRRVAAALRTGMVHLNGASLDSAAPFGGYRMSGNGREWGVFGLEEFLEVKSVFGGAAPAD